MAIEGKKRVDEWEDADFLSYLYSERERENSLSQYQGWNNWALAGAFITAICAAYNIWKDSYYLEVIDVVYYAGGAIGLFLTLQEFFYFFRRERGIDISRVRWLKEVVPIPLIIVVMTTSITSAIWIAATVGFNLLFWLWCFVLVMLLIGIGYVAVNRNKIVYSYADDFIFSSIKGNGWFYGITGGIYGLIGVRSFKVASSSIPGPEFEIGVCVAACMVMLYIFLSINMGSKAVKRFDTIIDNHLYLGVSKEKTFQEILKNRMGYSVMDMCYKELSMIESEMKAYEDELKKIESIKASVLNGEGLEEHFYKLQEEIPALFEKAENAMTLSRRLSDKLKVILRVAFGMDVVTAISDILDQNDKDMEKIVALKGKLESVIGVMKEAVEQRKQLMGQALNESCNVEK